MAHELMENEDGSYKFLEVDASGRGKAWHGLGTVITEAITATKALEHIGDYEVTRNPMWFTNASGVNIPVPDQFVITAGENVLGPCTKDFHPLQNRDIAKLLDPLSEIMQLETVGALRQGESIFWCFKNGEREIKGELHEMYWFIFDSKIPGKKLRCVVSPVRVVCQNTLNLGMTLGTIQLELKHHQFASQVLSIYTQLFKQMSYVEDTALALLNELGNIVLTQEQVNEVLEAIFPLPKKPGLLTLGENTGNVELLKRYGTQYQYVVNKTDAERKSVITSYERLCDEYPVHAGTGLGVVNAVVEVMDWYGREKSRSAAIEGGRQVIKSRTLEKVLTYRN